MLNTLETILIVLVVAFCILGIIGLIVNEIFAIIAVKFSITDIIDSMLIIYLGIRYLRIKNNKR